MRRALPVSLAAMLLCAGLPNSAFAGSYDVVSCGAAPGDVNNAWVATNNTPGSLTAATVCPAGSDQFGGLRAFDTLGTPDPGTGASAEWTFIAPAGTTITRWRYDRYLGKYDDNDWTAYGKLADGTVFDTCTIVLPADECSVGEPVGQQGGFRDLTGISTDKLVFGFRCDTAAGFTCGTGATLHHVWASIYSSTVTLNENTLPSVGAPSGALATGSGWHSGSESLSFTAADGSPGVGIKETRLYFDGQLFGAGTIARSCDYTLKIPCTDPGNPITPTVDTTQLPDGILELEVAALDAADNERRADPVTVRIDNNAPTHTIVAPTQTPRTDPAMQVTWNGNDGTGSGLASYDIEVSVNGGAYQPWLTGTTATGAGYTGAPGNRYRFRGRARDVSGLSSAFVTTHEVEVLRSPPPPSNDSGSGSAPPPGTDRPPAGAPPPAVQRRSTPGLRVTWARPRASRLAIAGVLPRAATGQVIVNYSARVEGRRVQMRRVIRVVAGRFRERLRLGPSLAAAGRGWLAVHYSGDARYRPRTVIGVVTR